MPLHLMGKKIGMSMLFDEKGCAIPCTVIEVEPNVVVQVKTMESDGYAALQLGYEMMRCRDERTVARRAGKPRLGHFSKHGITPRRHLQESRLEDVSGYQVGQEIGVDVFEEIAYVDVSAVTKGRGYQGVMRKYGFAGATKASHGAGPVHRHAGSTGMRSTPGRCLKGGPRPSQMGSVHRTVQSLRLFRLDKARNLLIVKGAVPGPNGAVVTIAPAVKKAVAK